MKKIDFKEIAVRTAGLGAGSVAAGLVVKHLPVLSKDNEKMDAILKSVVLVAGGALAPQFVGGGKNKLFNHVGDGMIASGARSLVGTLMPSLGIAGIEERYVAGFHSGNGFSVGNPTRIADMPLLPDYIPAPAMPQLQTAERELQYTV